MCDDVGCRCGGVIWYMQGLGKLLMMVMFVGEILCVVFDVWIVLVIDCIDLDEQIGGIFVVIGKKVMQVQDGLYFVWLICVKIDIVMILIYKFCSLVE